MSFITSAYQFITLPIFPRVEASRNMPRPFPCLDLLSEATGCTCEFRDGNECKMEKHLPTKPLVPEDIVVVCSEEEKVNQSGS
jgi:hypothetical protein